MKESTIIFMSLCWVLASTVDAQGTKVPTPIVCNQPYALCTSARCALPVEGSAKAAFALCPCEIVNGWSLGFTTCEQRMPVKGTSEFPGRLTSTFSFVGMAPPSKERLPCSEDTEDLCVQTCKGGTFANCLDSPCIVPEGADQAICICPMVDADGDKHGSQADKKSLWVTAVEGKDCGKAEEFCRKEVSSGALLDGATHGASFLTSFFDFHYHPDQPDQQRFCDQR